jgi:3'-phosphoadenosine 5'-phosphosulfate sulfotransferase (PAPS reductase)/FAD synthetase
MSHAARPMAGLLRERYRAHARSRGFRARLAATEAAIAAALGLMRAPYVAWSGGKDSSVLAHLVRAQRPGVPLRLLTSGETRVLHDVDTMCAWFRAQGATVEEWLIDRVFAPEWATADWTTQRRAGRGDLDRLNDGHDGVFLGLRAEESGRRARSLAMHRDPALPPWCHRYRTGPRAGMVRACPLARWTVDDVGAYLALHDIPVFARYHDEGLAARTTARLTGDAVRQNVLVHLRQHHLAGYRRLVRRFPELQCLT